MVLDSSPFLSVLRPSTEEANIPYDRIRVVLEALNAASGVNDSHKMTAVLFGLLKR